MNETSCGRSGTHTRLIVHRSVVDISLSNVVIAKRPTTNQPTLESMIHGFVPHGIVLNSEWIVDRSNRDLHVSLYLVQNLRTPVCIFSWTRRVQFSSWPSSNSLGMHSQRFALDACTTLAIIHIRWLVYAHAHMHTRSPLYTYNKSLVHSHSPNLYDFTHPRPRRSFHLSSTTD